MNPSANSRKAFEIARATWEMRTGKCFYCLSGLGTCRCGPDDVELPEPEAV